MHIRLSPSLTLSHRDQADANRTAYHLWQASDPINRATGNAGPESRSPTPGQLDAETKESTGSGRNWHGGSHLENHTLTQDTSDSTDFFDDTTSGVRRAKSTNLPETPLGSPISSGSRSSRTGSTKIVTPGSITPRSIRTPYSPSELDSTSWINTREGVTSPHSKCLANRRRPGNANCERFSTRSDTLTWGEGDHTHDESGAEDGEGDAFRWNEKAEVEGQDLFSDNLGRLDGMISRLEGMIREGEATLRAGMR